MFENLSTALIQALGFFGVFGFFVFQLIRDKNKEPSARTKNVKNLAKIDDKLNTPKNRFFRKKDKIVEVTETKKKRWFGR
tara:strand:+ start:501 stop:740 length:240 start_codon:yes stop_codon:yes gene_type:complete